MSAWAVIFLLLLAAGGAAAVWRTRVARSRSEGMPYARRANLLSPAGREFLQVLDAAAGPDHRVFIKVPATEILRVTRPANTAAYERAWQRLADSHFDFVVCKRVGMRVACVVQLDERSRHQRQLGEANPFLVEACRIAGLPTLRVLARRQYQVADIRARVKAVIASGRGVAAVPAQPAPVPLASARVSPAQQRVNEAIKAVKASPTHPSTLAPTLMASIIRSGEGAASVPSCPRCNGAMVRRHIHIGNHPGGDFWSCIRFPRCRGILPIVERTASSSA